MGDERRQLTHCIEGLRAGERSAFDAIVEWFWDPVMRYFWKRVALQDAEDLAQEVFISLYRALRNGQGPAETSLTHWRRYLFASAQNTLRSHWRRKRGSVSISSLENLFGEEGSWQDSVESASADSEPADPLVTDEQSTAVRDCLGQLDDLSRAVCWSHFGDGRSKREIAALIHVPESSLRDRLVRVMKDLRLCLEGKGIEWGG